MTTDQPPPPEIMQGRSPYLQVACTECKGRGISMHPDLPSSMKTTCTTCMGTGTMKKLMVVSKDRFG